MITQSAMTVGCFGYRLFVFGVAMMGMMTSGVPAEAADSQVPWECSNYSNEAQTRCLNAFIERQQQHIGQLEGQLQAQQEQMGQLRGQVDRQSQLQQQLSQPPVTTTIVPQPYPYPYPFAYPAYPPVGIGLYLGRPWGVPGIYGYYGRPYWGPSFYYRHYGRHW